MKPGYSCPPGYKQTEVGMIPEDWDAKTIDSIAFVTSGKRLPLGSSLTEHETQHPYIRVTDMRPGTVSQADIKFVPVEVFPAIKRYRIFKGDIFISVAGTLGIVGRVPRELDGANLTENADRITNITCSQNYLLHVLMSPLIQNTIDSLQTIGAQPKLALTRIRRFVVPLPPTKAEQEAIAEALSDADGLIESLERLLAKKRHLKQGAMQELLTGKKRLPGFCGEWIVKRLGTTATLKARIGWQGLTTAEYLDAGDYFLVTGTEFRDGYIDWEACHYVEESRYKQDKHIQLREHDVLVTKDGTIGKVALITDLPKPATLNSGVFVIRPIEDAFHPEFFYYLICSQAFTDFLVQLSAGSTINHLYQKDFVNFIYRTPPTIKEQTVIAAILSGMDAEIAALEAKLAKARAIKQGMMQELLTGRIRLVCPASNVMPLSTKAGGKTAGTPSHNQYINEAVVIAALTHRFATEKFPLGRFRRMKFTYLLHRHVEQEARGFVKQAAGPYNPTLKYGGAEKIALKNGYVREHHAGRYSGFLAGDNIDGAESYFAAWYGMEVLNWLEQFRRLSNDELELLTTVDMAGEELRRDGMPVELQAVKQVIRDHPEWEAKLTRPIFSDANITRAIAECRMLFGG